MCYNKQGIDVIGPLVLYQILGGIRLHTVRYGVGQEKKIKSK